MSTKKISVFENKESVLKISFIKNERKIKVYPSSLRISSTKSYDNPNCFYQNLPPNFQFVNSNFGKKYFEWSKSPNLLNLDKIVKFIHDPSLKEKFINDIKLLNSPLTEFKTLPISSHVSHEYEFLSKCCRNENHTQIFDIYFGSRYSFPVYSIPKYDPVGNYEYFLKARLIMKNLFKTIHNQTKRFRCLPAFYIFSTPKSGTTSLWKNLDLHPHIHLHSLVKETPYWHLGRKGLPNNHNWIYNLNHPAYNLLPDNLNYYDTFNDFLDLFDYENYQILQDFRQSKTKAITGLAPITMLTQPNDFWFEYHVRPSESEIETLTKNMSMSEIQNLRDELNQILQPLDEYHAAYLLKSIQPNAKFIAIFRNPTDRLFSDFQFFSHNTDKQYFHDLVVLHIKKFNTCLATRSGNIKSCMYEYRLFDNKHRDQHKIKLTRGLYSLYLAEWLRYFDSDQILCLNFEKMMGDPDTDHFSEMMNGIATFLGLDNFPEETIFDSKAHYSRWFIKNETDKQMLPETRQLLDQFYAPFNQILGQMLGSDFNFA